ncbi:hypothetical protein Sxan_22420 [Streptomyces xanthophaeus]|uniref:Cytochrome bc1 complex cytochrome b subunit n=1 Tax=Streptomyces xanthophaeus TaxID=67385 RepID=A0A919H1B1_9ACTN|nr:hypothetical protein Sxan_22420 [Streptomyces xanthophaeus]
MRFLVRKVFPDHWSFMFGEIALYSFVMLLLTGTWLTFFFNPSMGEVVYHGPYTELNGVRMSEAYASTIKISFEIRGGLFIRQVHHWSALIMIGALCLHTMRHFFTGSFRKPREANWLIGFVLLVLVTLEGFLGYSLPDDLLSGTGLRIAEGVTLAIPVVGTYLVMFLFGGEFPGHDVIGRFIQPAHPADARGDRGPADRAPVHGLLPQAHPVPGSRTHREERRRTASDAALHGQGGRLLLPGHRVLALIAGIAQINPVWNFGPYRSDQISQGSQPDWYMGFLEGALRAFPAWEFTLPGGYNRQHGRAGPRGHPAHADDGRHRPVPFLEAWSP